MYNGGMAIGANVAQSKFNGFFEKKKSLNAKN